MNKTNLFDLDGKIAFVSGASGASARPLPACSPSRAPM